MNSFLTRYGKILDEYLTKEKKSIKEQQDTIQQDEQDRNNAAIAKKTIAARKLKHGATTLSEEKVGDMKKAGAKFKAKE